MSPPGTAVWLKDAVAEVPNASRSRWRHAVRLSALVGPANADWQSVMATEARELGLRPGKPRHTIAVEATTQAIVRVVGVDEYRRSQTPRAARTTGSSRRSSLLDGTGRAGSGK